LKIWFKYLALSNCKLWAVDRQTFQAIMMRAGMQKQTEHLELLKKYIINWKFIIINLFIDFSIKTFESLREDILSKISDAVDQVSYADGECIVRQGAKGDTFYIVAKGLFSLINNNLKINRNFFIGRVQITQSKSKWDSAVYIRHLERGDSFGEDALQS
jgi:cGMP-dependent protein kinase